MTANRVLTALVVLAVLTALLTAGIALMHGVAKPAVAQGVITQQYTMADIDAALASGPVFLEFETKECSYCKQQRPISESLASDYSGKVTFIFADASQNRELARAFQVSGVPQMDIILDKTSSGYTYVGKGGQTSDSVGQSRFIGLTQSDTFKTALDAAVRMRSTGYVKLISM